MSTPNGSTRNFIPIQHKYDRVVLLVDMDCFYCQVEEKLNPELKGQPLAVVQYNAWRGGGIIAVNYAARAKGVTRHMRGDEAKEQCPEIQLVKVPNVREKADLSKYREAGKEVANVLQRFTTLLERASVDEAYLDITEAVNKRLAEMNAGTFVLQPQELINTYAVGYERIGDYLKVITSHFANPYASDDYLNTVYDAVDVPSVRQSDVRLLLGASIASEIRAAVKTVTSYECSAGIAHNKILAKLACGMNKPNKQTILPLAQVEKLFETLPVGKIKGLGAKFGEEVCERLKIRYLGQMLKYTEAELQKAFDEKNGTWLYYICRGIDLEAVTPRFYSKSIGCCKKFPGRNNITGLNTLKHWLKELATEIAERLEKDIAENNRKAKQMTVSYIQELDNEEVSSSRSVPLIGFDIESLAQRSLEVIKTNTKQFFRLGSDSVINNPIKFLGISVGKFETIASGQTTLQEMFANQANKKRKSDTEPTSENIPAASQSSPQQQHTLKKQSSQSKHLCDEDKMKGFFTKYFQNKSNNVKEEQEKKEPRTQVTPKPNPEKQSFFVTALSKNTSPNDLVSKHKPSELSPKDVDSMKLDDILKLEAELKAIAEDNIPDEVIEPTQDDSHGSPQRKKTKLNNADETLEPIEPNYEAQYAEYATPELRLDLLEFQRCELCGAKIPVDERALQTHQDHHFAQQLSQKQREEFRMELKSKQSLSKPLVQTQKTPQQPKSKSTNDKKSNNKASTKSAADITKFLKAKPTSPTPLSSSLTTAETTSPKATTSAEALTMNSAEDMLPCSDCNMLIKVIDFEEHKDYHLAKQLQRELNKLEVHTVTISKKASSSSSSSANKALNKTFNSNAQRNVAAKPITQFFTQSQTESQS